MPNSYRVFILEGLPGTGKSTLLELLASNFESSIPEIILDGDIKEVDGNQEFFIKNDAEKMLQAKKNTGCVLMDRWFASTLAYNYSTMVVDGLKNYHKILHLYTDYLKNNQVSDYLYIYLDIDPLISLSRKKDYSNPDNPVWTSEKHLNVIKRYYDEYFLSLKNENRVVIIDCREKSLDKIAEEIKAIKVKYCS